MSTNTTARSIFRTFQEARHKKSIFKRVNEYRGFVSVQYETDDFIVTTARSGHQLFKILELRHEIFTREWQNRRAFHGLDVDDFDFTADHLMIIEKRTNEVVGTYRLLSSHFNTDFYSAGEFEMDRFIRQPTIKLEMGRACVHQDYRDGRTIDLLWKGLTRYIFVTKTEFLFGCASVKSIDPLAIGRIYKSLRDNEQWSDEFTVRATWDYQFPTFSMNSPDGMAASEKRELMPALLRSYLHAGAKVYGWPALDRDFACTDLLTILDWKKLNPRFQSRFVVKDI